MSRLNIKYVKFDSIRRFGVELEIGSEVKKTAIQQQILQHSSYGAYVSRYSLSSNNSYWHIKDDATCGTKGRHGPKGVEIASFIGSGIRDIEHISFIAAKLQDFGCKANNNCGLHIHAEIVDFTKEQVCILIALWIKLEKLVSMLLPSRRHHSEHCKFMMPLNQFCKFKLDRKKKYDTEEFWELVCPKDLGYCNNQDRKYNLNIVNLVRAIKDNSMNRRTVELRWPEGTLNSVDVRCWVKLFLLFIERCKDHSMPNNLKPFDLDEGMRVLGLHHEKNSFAIYSENVLETKTWFLERIIEHKNDSLAYHGDCVNLMVDDAKKNLNSMFSPFRNYA